MSSKSTGEKAAIAVVILALILSAAVIASVPYAVPASHSLASPATGTSTASTGQSTGASTDVVGPPDTTDAASGNLSSFKTYSQLDSFITANAKSMQQVSGYPGGVVTMTVEGGTTTVAGSATMIAGITTATFSASATIAASTITATETASGTTSAGGPSFTTTNDQVQGVDELDIVKTDGTYLYVASSQTVSIVRAYPVNASGVVSTIDLPNFSVLGMTLAPQRLAVLGQSLVNSSVSLRLYDVSNPAAPVLLNSIAVSGSFVGARTTQGYFYLVVQQPSFTSNGGGNVTAAYPTVKEDGVSSVISPGSTYYTPNRSQVNVYTMVLTMSMSTGAESSVAVLTGPSSTIYVSASNIYVVYSNFYPFYADGISGDVYNGGQSFSAEGQQQNSTVFRVAYSAGNITVAAAGSFPGGVLNQYSMNEYENHFMVATSRSGIDDVFVLDQNLSQAGAIRNIAPGENIYAVRFEGDLGYVVTFVQVDPLFTISFADPNDPVILSALHVTGFSDYLYPFGTGYLVGVGKDTVNASNGDFAYYLGLKLSLFNVTSANSTEVANYMIGSRGTDSAVLDDPLAFTFDTATNTMVIPVDLYTNSSSQSSSPSCSGCPPQYGQFTWQGAYVFSVSTTGFKLLGTVTQNLPGQSPSTNEIDRSVIIGDVLYTISQNEVMASSLSSFSTLATIQLTQ